MYKLQGQTIGRDRGRRSLRNWKAYSFEAKAIQKFVFASGKLRDSIGASALIDALAMPWQGASVAPELASLFDHVCAVTGLPFGADAVGFVSIDDATAPIEAGVVRKAGGVVTFVWQTGGDDTPNMVDQAFARFRPLWAVAVREAVPGIEFIDGVGQGAEIIAALDDVQKALGIARNRPVIARPSITPFVALAPRTGEPAVSHAYGVPVDRATMAKTARQWTGADGVAANLLDAPDTWQWPIDLEDQSGEQSISPQNDDKIVAFPFRARGNGNANRMIGLLHIDGNGLGQSLIAVRNAVSKGDQAGDAKTIVNALYHFSLMIQDVTVKAAKAAMGAVIDGFFAGQKHADAAEKPVLPVRPILLGGDDITVLLRADCALTFAKSFIKVFEHEARNHPDAPKGVAPMTACGGLVFAGASHPFAKLAELAESLCAHAKAEAKSRVARQGGQTAMPVPGALSIHRIKTADHGHYDDIIADELTVRDSGLVLTMNPYFIQDMLAEGRQDMQAEDCKSEAPALSDLENLGDLLSEDGFARGPLRELMSLIYLPPDQAKQRYRRWRSVLQKTKEGKDFWKRYCAAMGALCGHDTDNEKISQTLFEREVAHQGVTPLLDALMLEGMVRGTPSVQEVENV